MVAAVSVRLAPAAPPPGFSQKQLAGGWNEIAGIAPLEDGRAVAWERGGRVWMMTQEGERIEPPMLDLHEEVGGWRDHGLLGVAPHPEFLSNGWLYLLYVVDRHHLLYFGTPDYDPDADWYFAASIGRITRYTAQSSTRFTTVDLKSRLVLLGESKSTGIPVVHQSHGVGSLLFGEDGTLLASVGDNASYEGVDLGGQVSGGYVSQALADGILRGKENVGSFRSQLVDCLCGKVLRLDPMTGDGVPSNPFFDPTEPRSPRSRVWCIGLRNPFRMTIEPGTGCDDPADADPGTLHVGDVGWLLLEELNRAPAGGLNFGWPVFEGLTYHNDYGKADVPNPDAANPLGGPGCNEVLFRFRTLIRQDSQVSTVPWLNPCGMHQVETATSFGALSSTAAPGYTGVGYAAFTGGAGSWIQWSVNLPTSATWTVAVRHSNAGPDTSFKLLVDGAIVADPVSAPSTGADTEWRVVEVPVALSSGQHTMRIQTNSSGGLNVDGVAIFVPGHEPLIDSVPTFVHTRPVADWHHFSGLARVPTFAAGGATEATIGDRATAVEGEPFGGQCAIGGPVLGFETWPEEWRDQVLLGDFSSAWLRTLRLDAFGRVVGVDVFDPSFGNVVGLIARPGDESIWAIRWPGQLHRIAYESGGNQPPAIAVSTSQPWGPSPLAVTFDASASSDPEGGPVDVHWDFGDGSAESGATVTHTFIADSDAPQAFHVTLTATDGEGGTSVKTIVVSANNSPPVVQIASVYDGQPYPLDGPATYPLVAMISDAEHGDDELSCEWIAVLHHESQSHPEPSDPDCESSMTTLPVGCGAEEYWYEATLTVTDAAGLTTFATAGLVPDCGGLLSCEGDIDLDGAVGATDLGILLGGWNSPATWMDLGGDGVVDASDLALLLGHWGPCP